MGNQYKVQQIIDAVVWLDVGDKYRYIQSFADTMHIKDSANNTMLIILYSHNCAFSPINIAHGIEYYWLSICRIATSNQYVYIWLNSTFDLHIW